MDVGHSAVTKRSIILAFLRKREEAQHGTNQGYSDAGQTLAIAILGH